MKSNSLTLPKHFKQKLRLIIAVGYKTIPIELRELGQELIEFSTTKELSFQKTRHLRADLLLVDAGTLITEKMAQQLISFIHEAGSLYLENMDDQIEQILVRNGLAKTNVPQLFTRCSGFTPKEYGTSYIERWGNTDFMKNWRLASQNILEHLPRSLNPATMRVLDVGCLNGYIMESLRRAGVKHLYGTDISYEIAVNRTVSQTLLPAITIEDFADDTFYPDGFSDVTICMEVLEHIPPENTDRFIAQLGRVTSSRGVILISTSEDWDVDATHTNCRKRPEWYSLFSKHRMVPYGEQVIFSGFNSFIFKKAHNPIQKLFYQSVYVLSTIIPLWGGLRVLRKMFPRPAKR